MDVQALHTDEGIVLGVPDTDEPPPAGIAELAAEEVEPIVTAELGGSALFASRFRECAARALLLPRRRPGRRSPLWQQRQRSAQLLAVASKYGTFPVVLETVRECLQDTFDVPALAGLMRDLARRKWRLGEGGAEPGRRAAWVAELDASRRAIEVRIGGEARWAAIEDAGRLRDALGVPLPPGVPAAFTEPVPDPLGDLVARYARCHGPFTAPAAAKRYGLGVAVITGTLQPLAAEHRVVHGDFSPGVPGTERCDPELVRILR